MTSATQFLNIRKTFQFRRGGSIPGMTLAYETWGKLNRKHSNAVMILTGISPSAHAASNSLDPAEGWWEPVIGPGKPIDTNHSFVVCINSLGSCKGSTGPASINPETGKPYRLSFPEVTIWDIATAAQFVLDHLGIEQLRVMVGPSMGGMSGLAWLYQNQGAAFLNVSSSASLNLQHCDPLAAAQAIVCDPEWHDGNYTAESWREAACGWPARWG
jgi:homoserine O-acetyltransferase